MKLPKVYEPSLYEDDIYALWEQSQAFEPRQAGKSFSVVVPPPNANGNLHIGHALTLTLEDIAVRYHRLKGESALLLPGADHAGFETQVVYEKQLAKQGKSRFDFTREELYAGIFDFVAQNRANFTQQFRRLGAGVDWTRFAFTLDEKIVRRAYATFKKMWDEGLIYRGERLVNFCTFHGTAFADVEVVFKEAEGSLWHIRYPLTDGSGDIVVATTRPETMLGDTAVAVHPDDQRYGQLRGKTVTLPLVGREIPIIADDFVEQDFGTGAVKITPAHDPNDFDAGKRHQLPMISVIDHEGNLTGDMPAAYRGLPVVEARQKIVADLQAHGFLVKSERLTHNVGHCYKCGTVIEPLLREQWFVDMQPLAKAAIKALRAGEVAFYPESKKDQLIGYLQHLRDWNISRQIAWGIPIPAFQNVNDPDDWVYDERVTQEIIEVDGKTYRRDPDVFDTWFSSSSWPYATLNFGDPASDDFEQFYPLSLMETGSEILYPWVSRMLMLGLYVTGQVPFKAVYIHGYVLAEDGSKMSKSVGNVIDPSEPIEKYGADALRLGIIASRAPAVNRGYDHRKVEDARNFCNKLWNIARYIEGRAGTTKSHGSLQAASDADHWLLNKLQQTTEAVGNDLDQYRFAEAYEQLYHFVWDDLADWYIEAAKAQENVPLLTHTLESVLKLLHPFAPFVTETIWQTLAWEPDSVLAAGSWPVIAASDPQRAAAFESVKGLVTEVRGILKNLELREAALSFAPASAIEDNRSLIKRLARLTSITLAKKGKGLKLTQTDFDAWLDVSPEVAQRYGAKLAGQRQAEAKVVTRLKQRLANRSYADNAPAHVVAQTRTQLEEAESRLAAIEAEARRYAAE